MGQPLKQGEDAILQDIAHLERVMRRIAKDPERPDKQREMMMEHLRAVIMELHRGYADRPLKRTG